MPDFSNQTILVTGAAGFIGSHLCEALLAAGARVIGLDNFDPFYDRALKEQNLEACLRSPHFHLLEGDIRDSGMLQRAFTQFRPQVVVHLAARAGVRPSLIDPLGYEDVNVRGTMQLLEAARGSGIRDFVFASSSSVYGEQSRVPFRENENTDQPLSPYGATKKSGEVLCHAYHHLYGLSIACLRFFTVYGPRQRPDLAIRKFARAILAGEEVTIYGDGSSQRDYTHVSDTVGGILGAIRWCAQGVPHYDIFNLGSAHPVALNELIALLERFAGVAAISKQLPPQPGDVSQTYADTTRAEAELGFRHRVEFETGLRDFMEWIKQTEHQ
ncbi:SDR family NAD(P)-dependent oxidoreductase [candidate division KSB1 bacterium]|nr:SDR family NAD(P)-dependent oxidoreductase [candidate division KSB1 bacterium]